MFLNLESCYTISYRLPVYNFDYLYTISNLLQTTCIQFRSPSPIGTPPKFSHRSLRLIATKAGSSAAPIPLVLSSATAASRAARRPASASAPAPRPAPAPTLTARQRPSDSACARSRSSGRLHLRRRATPPAPRLSGKFWHRRLPLLSPRRSESPRRAAPTRARPSRPPAVRSHFAPTVPPARPPARFSPQ